MKKKEDENAEGRNWTKLDERGKTALLVQDLAWVVRKLGGEWLEEGATTYPKRPAKPKRHLENPLPIHVVNDETKGPIFHLVGPQWSISSLCGQSRLASRPPCTNHTEALNANKIKSHFFNCK